jgi:serine/tyrosine/threonine adenylyltransferase
MDKLRTMNFFNFDNTYSKLNRNFYAEVQPSAAIKPELLILNEDLAQELNIDFSAAERNQIAAILSGQSLPNDAQPLAMAYAGHQFGHFTMLGDGRAILLGEHISNDGKRFDIQLKGSGRTPFSRGGDGKATLRSMLREYVMSECMYHLGVSTSRSLAVVKTGTNVNRESIHEGAVLTRIMESHLRVGTFEYARQFLGFQEQKELLNYTINRHFPEISQKENQALEFLKAVQRKQLSLIVHWMRIGFIHGVMNTDNMHIGGQTFDYGPCAFMNTYDPKTVFSSIDSNGRYAYINQPEIALWNLSVLAGSILPQIHENQEIAVALARDVLNNFTENYKTAWREMMCSKIGLKQVNGQSMQFLDSLLNWMEKTKADYTNTFLVISEQLPQQKIPFDDNLKHWIAAWKIHIKDTDSWNSSLTLMKQHNPIVIPRNHLVEQALDQAIYNNNLGLLKEIITAVKSPESIKNIEHFQFIPDDAEHDYKTFCGT